ncbi:Cytochrome c-type biogenesis protein CcmF [Hartmannibacter diazotrophicus]|uniref:Cytochrome c-type biogenesis protein CcmF n=1 Tax=Hartmannibacter diazotrophicus TaxID=1482074 RepID=A0A2C9D636_9HYPH|nr:heme lyase CcmF/NrfE family subunit [Hartmannibacter diazotrophicus]SON54985.1 Cytochrome c-type biogenesis protein CcmF [Hartmannibacter diazotrophicus]
MISEIGHFALVLALAVALVQSVVPVYGARRRDDALMAMAGPAAITQLALTAMAFAALVHAYVVSDFSLLNVYQNSHSEKPLLYKVTGVWSNHEGSMLLWVLILAIFGGAVAFFGGTLPRTLKANVLGVQAWISVSFLSFILATSNPFTRLSPAPMEGKDLNPILQDIGLAIHPPLLYLGYVGFSISFAFAVAALIDGKIDAAWARWVRPWTLAAWCFLTAGIAMGSYWAYYELGWGGWWFWDPVENASFMPWLVGTALLHSALVMEKRDALKIWTILLSILTFSLSLLGTFLVRSGVLTSVHSFASDPARGVFILCILMVFIGGSLSLFAWRASVLKPGGIFAPISREGSLVLNNLFLTAACATVLVGTLYPMVLEAVTGKKISVGAPFFNLTFGPLMLPLLFAVPFGPLLAWKRGDILAAAQRLFLAFGLGILAVLAVLWYVTGAPVLSALGIGLAIYLLVGSVAELGTRAGFLRNGFSGGMRRLAGLPRSAFGTALAHAGLGLTLAGIVTVTSFETEKILVMRSGETASIGGFDVTFDGFESRKANTYREVLAHMTVREGGNLVTSLAPAKRMYEVRQMPTTEAAIYTHGVSQLYVTLGDITEDNRGVTVRMWEKPFVTLIWIGALVMMAGGVLSLSDRRLRVGAPKPARAPVRAAPAE